MKAVRIFLFVLILIGLALLATQKMWVPKFVDRIMIMQHEQTATSSILNNNTNNNAQVYTNAQMHFSVQVPRFATTVPAGADSYLLDEAYHYEQLGLGKEIAGVKFTIPEQVATGTNLGTDSYISIEAKPNTSSCSALLFTNRNTTAYTQTDAGVQYSVASTSDAGAGNRYNETVYALMGTSPCIAVRYFVHYSVFENYPPGMVKQFDENALVGAFDRIRRTLTLTQ